MARDLVWLTANCYLLTAFMAQATYLEAIRQWLRKAGTAALLLCVTSASLIAQVRDTKLPAPEKIVSLVQQECTAESKAIRQILRLPCQAYEKAAGTRVRLEPGVTNFVITAFDQETLSIVVLRLTIQGVKHVDTRTFASKYQEPVVSFPSLIEPGVQEIAVDQETLIRGSGLLENHQVVYKLLRGHLTLVFDQAAKTALKGWGTATDRDERSEFRFEPATRGEPGSIYQRTVYKDHAREFTVYRAYLWDRETERFRQSPVKDLSMREWEKLARLSPAQIRGKVL